MSSSVSVNSLRSLIFDGSIPISITIAETDLSDSVDKLIDTYYVSSTVSFAGLSQNSRVLTIMPDE